MKMPRDRGAGFIGSNLVDALLARGRPGDHRRRPLDGAAAEHRAGARGRRELAELDVRDRAALELAVERVSRR